MADTFIITSSSMVALWQLIVIAKRNNPIQVKIAIAASRDSGLIGGDVPSAEGLKLGQICKLLHIDDEKNLLHTDYCREKLIPFCDTDEPNIIVTRIILLRYMSFRNFDWLLFFNDDPQFFKASIPLDWVDLLDNNGLFEFDDPEVRNWWSEVFDRFETYQEGKKLEQGKVAEKLTFDFERYRLETDGFDNSLKFVKWASQINDKYGYDILSVRGNLLQHGFNGKDKIQIEVKSAASSSMEEFRFFVSKPEWKTALDNIDSYYFFCWIDTNLQKQSASGPFIIPAKDLTIHVPQDHSPICDWSECRFVLDLNEYRIS